MNQQQLLEVLNTVKTNVDTVNVNLTDTAASLTEATTEILARLAELKDLQLSPDVAAIVQALAAATDTVVAETTNISQQSHTLAGIVPDPEPTV